MHPNQCPNKLYKDQMPIANSQTINLALSLNVALVLNLIYNIETRLIM